MRLCVCFFFFGKLDKAVEKRFKRPMICETFVFFKETAEHTPQNGHNLNVKASVHKKNTNSSVKRFVQTNRFNHLNDSLKTRSQTPLTAINFFSVDKFPSLIIACSLISCRSRVLTSDLCWVVRYVLRWTIAARIWVAFLFNSAGYFIEEPPQNVGGRVAQQQQCSELSKICCGGDAEGPERPLR